MSPACGVVRGAFPAPAGPYVPGPGRRHRRLLATAAGVAGMLTLTGAAVGALSPAVLQQAPVLRLRVVAASNRPADQAEKRLVRDAVVAQIAPVVRRARTLAQARRLLRADLHGVRAAAQAAAGPATAVAVRLGPDRFPERTLGLLHFPAGEYATLLVTLGAGAGHNWWTVLFPPFAFVSFGPHLAVVGPDRGGAAEPAFHAADGAAGADGVAVVRGSSRRAAPIEVRFALWDLWKQLARNW